MMKKEYIANILVILLAVAVFIGIGFLIKKDINSVSKHLENCKKQCDPAEVAEQFSKKYCMCRPIIKYKSELDKQ